MSEINWKNKYEGLKSKFMQSVDASFRLGFEQGAQDAQMQAAQDQAQQQAEMQAQGGDPNAQPGEEGQPQEQEQQPDSAHPEGSELDQHIQELESMLGKGEIDMTSLIKSVKGFREFQTSLKQKSDLKKSHQAISEISKALHKPKYKIGVQANHNLSSSAKKAVTMQQEIVENIMKSWDEEKEKTGKGIVTQLKVEGLIKGE